MVKNGLCLNLRFSGNIYIIFSLKYLSNYKIHETGLLIIITAITSLSFTSGNIGFKKRN